jgi:hypothetical protein
MAGKYRRVFIILLLACLPLFMYMQWPVEEGKITSIFGESRSDHFHDGIDMVSAGGKIFPVEDGELVYLWDKALFPLENYPGSGNYRVFKHKDGMYSLYLHLADTPVYKDIYQKTETFAMIGDTGRSYGKHLHYTLIRYDERKSINPLKNMPDYADRIAPEIGDIYVRTGDKYSRIRENANVRLTQHYPLLVEIKDCASGKERLGIYQLSAVFNDKKVMDVIFSDIAYSKNGLTIAGKTFQALYDEKGYYKIDPVLFIEGINTLKVTARDYSGNESAKTISFNVRLDIRQ